MNTSFAAFSTSTASYWWWYASNTEEVRAL
jgi:hypothetical protein